MDAHPLLAQIARLLEQYGIEAILIGNAAAALQGAPVTTIDLDFLFRPTPRNVKNLKAFAAALDAVILKPYYPVSGLYRVARDEDGLQLDFMSTIHGLRSLEGLRKRSKAMRFGEVDLRVASLADVFNRKKVAIAPAPATEPSWRFSSVPSKPKRPLAKLEALKRESELAERDLIRRWQALPPEKRTHFLRKRVGLRMSCL